MTDLETVAFDIETTGFGIDDRLTVAGFDAPIGSKVFLNAGGRAAPSDLDQRVAEETGMAVSLSTHTSEAALLAAIAAFAEARLADRDVKLVAYNGERWNGGFDLPFLRTRLSRHDIDWPFAGLPYIDVLEVVETRFNTTDDTLETVYADLVGDGLNELDPFADSSDAVTAWEAGDFGAVVRHNLADIRRTRAVTQVAERYCSKSDFSMKSLDPVL